VLLGGVFGYNGMMKKKVKTKWGINVLGSGEILVKSGDKVLEGQVLVKIKDKIVKSFDFSRFLSRITSQELLELNKKFFSSWVSIGEVLCVGKGMFSGKVCFPIDGNFLSLDEFGVLKIEQEDKTEKEILSPVNSKILKIDENKIFLGFEVYEFKGEGLVEGKVWGKGEIKLINDNKGLGFGLKDNLLFTNNLSKLFLLKAEVVGVKGIVTNTKQEEILTDLPVLYLDDNEWKELFRSEDKIKNFLLNSRVGRLLMVLE
jgi:hypothetical protein